MVYRDYKLFSMIILLLHLTLPNVFALLYVK
uniref:Uncharacterized protein n=1 Tax=Anguilla anguilla TaxID=7936 RepID=A0A0E9QAQ8_ANGAN